LETLHRPFVLPLLVHPHALQVLAIRGHFAPGVGESSYCARGHRDDTPTPSIRQSV
jgi:hypothetical protein